MRKTRACFAVSISLVLLVCFFAPAAMGGELQIIDKSNYEKVKGLVPEPVLKWFQKGEWMMRVGSLEADWTETQPSWIKKSRTENIGKYALSADNTIVDAKTGKTPGFIKGIPFPKIDPKDPKAGAKIMYNGNMVRQNNGPLRTAFRLTFMDGKSKSLERFIMVNWWSYAFAGWPPAANIPNPDNLEFYTQVLIKEPYDMAGTALMTWRYLDNKKDLLFGYVPAIRRVRRLTPAGRSDALFGSDFAQDDGGYAGYDGKIGDMEWKVIGEGTILAGFNSAKPQPIVVNDKGEWVIKGMEDREKYAAYGYEKYSKKYYKGDVAPWCQTNTIWTKRPVWIIEGRAKNPYYNFGREIHWVDKETFTGYWKQIFDRSDEYWKMYWATWGWAATADGKEAGSMIISMVLDERLNHCSAIDAYCKDCFYINNAKANDLNQFSLAGFTKLSK
jgi:Protein of unknown function (DUF1329)